MGSGKSIEDILAEARRKAQARMAQKSETKTAPAERIYGPGDRIMENYQVLSDVITGGMGNVWEVLHLRWNCHLAMKRPKSAFFTDRRDKDNFTEECRAWIELGMHPNIVSCYYVQEIDGVPCVFSQWMEGGSLADAIRAGTLYAGTPREQQERLLRIALDFARGLRYAHEHDMIHQDVKPANVLLANDWQAKVSDFGLARSMPGAKSSSDGEGSDYTVSTPSGGYTLFYSSPEQLNGETLNKRTDIFSWAVSVMEMYLGSRPWISGSAAAAGCRSYFPVCRVPMPLPMQELLAQCMAQNSNERPHSFASVEEALLAMAPEVFGREVSFPQLDAKELTLGNLNNRALSLLQLGKEQEARALWESVMEKGSSGDPLLDWNYALYLWNRGEIGHLDFLRRVRFSAYCNGEEYSKQLEAFSAYCNSICSATETGLHWMNGVGAAKPEDRRLVQERVASFLSQYPVIQKTNWRNVLSYTDSLSVLLAEDEVALFNTRENCFVKRIRCHYGWRSDLEQSAVTGNYLLIFLSDSLQIRELPSLRCVNLFSLPSMYSHERMVAFSDRKSAEILIRTLSPNGPHAVFRLSFGEGGKPPAFELSEISSLIQIEEARNRFSHYINEAEALYARGDYPAALKALGHAERQSGYTYHPRCRKLRHRLAEKAPRTPLTAVRRIAVRQLPYDFDGFQLLEDGTTYAFDQHGKWLKHFSSEGELLDERNNWNGKAREATSAFSAQDHYSCGAGKSFFAYGAYEDFFVVDRKSFATKYSYHFDQYYFSHTLQLFSPGEKYLAIYGFVWNGVRTVHIVEMRSGKVMMSVDLPFQEIASLAFDKEETQLFIGGSEGMALLLDLERRKVRELKPLRVPNRRAENSNIVSCCFSEDGSRVYLVFDSYGTEERAAMAGLTYLDFGGGSAVRGTNFYVYDIRRKNLEPVANGIDLTHFCLLHHDRFLAYTCFYSDVFQNSVYELHLLDLATGTELYSESNPTGRIHGIAGNEELIVSRSDDGLQFYDLRYEPQFS